MRSRGIIIVVVIAVALVASSLVFYAIDETEVGVLTQFGRPVAAITTSGLHAKWPDPVQTIKRFDRRLQVYNPPEKEYLTSDKKAIRVESYVTWRLVDPTRFLVSVGEKGGAETRLADIVTSELGVAFGRFSLASLVTTDEAAFKLPEAVRMVVQTSDAKVAGYGMEVTDVQIKLLNFPDANRQAVFSRMKAEREQIARQYRAEGSGQAAQIRAEAERQQKVIVSEAYARAEQLRGEGDAEAMRVYAAAYNRDPEFYRFVRTLEAYGKIVDDKTTIVMPSDSELLKYLTPTSGR